MNKNLFTGFMIASMFFLLVIFFQQCSTNKKIDKEQILIKELQYSIDSFALVEANKPSVITLKQVEDEMESTMLDFLIYESDLDKGKTSLSQIKNKIEENDK